MVDGHVNKCKDCNKRDVRDNRALKIEYYREFDRNRPNHVERVSKQNDKVKERYANDEDFKQNIIETRERWLKFNRHKRTAQSAVSNAVRDEKLDKPSVCSCCETTNETIYGHHWSYEEVNWLDVMWLCAKCHGKEHKRINECKRKDSPEYEGVENAQEGLQLLLDYVKDK